MTNRFGAKFTSTHRNVNISGPLDTSFDNGVPFLKAFKQGVAAVKVTGAGTFTVDITHGLGYTPIFVHMGALDPANPSRRFIGRSAASGAGGEIGIDSYATKEVIRLAWREPTGGLHSYPFYVTFYVYIFYDSLDPT